MPLKKNLGSLEFAPKIHLRVINRILEGTIKIVEWGISD